MKTRGVQLGSKRTPKGMCVIGRASGQMGKRMTERLNRGVEMEARESDRSPLSLMGLVEKLNLVKLELKNRRRIIAA